MGQKEGFVNRQHPGDLFPILPFYRQKTIDSLVAGAIIWERDEGETKKGIPLAILAPHPILHSSLVHLMKYQLPCSCGESIPLDITQAGQTVTCRCGEAQQAPSLLKTKKLPMSDKGSSSVSRTIFAFCVQLCFLCLACSVLILPPLLSQTIMADQEPPTPQDVLKKQIRLTYGRTAWQDSLLTPRDRKILMMLPENIDQMPPFWVFDHFRTLKGGPMLSDAFRKNYQELKDAYQVRNTKSNSSSTPNPTSPAPQ